MISSPAPGSRLARMTKVRQQHAAGRLGIVQGIQQLRQIYPHLTMKPGGWYRLLRGE